MAEYMCIVYALLCRGEPAMTGFCYTYYSCTVFKEHPEDIQTSDFQMTTILLYTENYLKMLMYEIKIELSNRVSYIIIYEIPEKKITMIAITLERKNEKAESKECIGNTYFM
ncbi:uncharacterized protein LOC126551409 [Aphis gossypii]|uniref:uncharacterized protein LOC126551409 n=1 Tax=Aphis gossypii TaxID=80765 RepID=UPI00215925B8|nr:uncharacterized protein LOC126551409 [Aphis gossypii]